MLPNLSNWVRFWRLFGHRILGNSTRQKTEHEDTKEEADTKTRRITISARCARKWISPLCLRVLVAGLMTAPVAGAFHLGEADRIGRGSERFASTETFLHEVNLSIRLNSSAMNKSGKNPNDR
jgi:hypothetical protein